MDEHPGARPIPEPSEGSLDLPAAALHRLPTSLSWRAAMAFATAYSTLLFVGYALQITVASITTIWPAEGLLLVVLMLFRKRDWLRIILISAVLDVVVNKLTPGIFHLDSAVWYAGAHVLGAAIGAEMAQRWVGDVNSQQQAVKFYLVGAISCALGTTVSAVLFISRHSEASPTGEWLRWWAGSFLGVVAFAPLAIMFIAHWRRPQGDLPQSSWIRFAAFNGLLAAVTAWIFGAVHVDLDFDSGFQFVIFPILVVIALQTPPRWAMASSAIAVVLAAALTNRGLGPFASSAAPTTAALSLQVFLALAAAMTFMISIAANETRQLLGALTFSTGRFRREARLLRTEIERREALEHERAEVLRRNNQLASLVRHSQEFIGIATLDGQADFINDVGRKLIGLAPEASIAGLSISDILHPTEHERLAREIIPAVLTRGHWSGEVEFRRLGDGAPIPMLVEAFRIDDDGRPLWLATVSLNITDRKLAATKLKMSEMRLRTIIDTEPECVKMISQDGSLLEMNGAGLAMLEAESVEQARAFGLANFVCPEYRTAFATFCRRVISGEQGRLEFEAVGLRGTRRWLHTAAAPMWDDNLAETVLLGITSDITQRKRLEGGLAAELARNRLFLRTASDGVHIQNAKGMLVEVSESFCKMLGYSRDELIGMNPSQWDARLSAEELGAAFAALTSGAVKRFKTLHRRKDGTIYPVEINVESFDVDGERHVYCSARDITEQRRLERALLEAATNEQQKLGRDVHDGLGQELTGISLLASAIASSLKKVGRPEAAEVEKVAEFSRRAIASCRAIAHGLSPVTFADGGLVEILREMVMLQRNSFGVDATYEVTEAAPLRLNADTLDNLYRIAQEAVANARRHGRAKSIQVTLDVQPTSVRLDVTDDGIGFGSAAATSTGMGLKIMQVRAAAIGARVSITPRSQGGSLVRCECPQPGWVPRR